MSIGLIIQARMSSQRLAGKVLHRVAGKPMLKYLIERLDFCKTVKDIVIATSIEKSDDPIASFCDDYGIKFYRGSLNNVALRFKEVLDIYKFDTFIRTNADSPLLDFNLINRAIKYLRNGDYDIVTNAFPRSFPVGQSVEVIRTSTFEQAYEKMSKPAHFEHITKYYYEHSEEFRINNFSNDKDLSSYRLVVDTPEDLKRIEKIIGSMTRPHTEYGMDELIELYPSV